MTPGLKRANSALLWIGSRELSIGGSVLAELLGMDGPLPAISYKAERSAMEILAGAIAGGVVLSCRAISDGGMLTALARLAFDARVAGRHWVPRSTSAIRCAKPAASSARSATLPRST